MPYLDRQKVDLAVEKLLSSLNFNQKRVVTSFYDGPIQVVAGPGTGKTKVLTSTIVYLLLRRKVEPRKILITTFSKKAANEMKARVEGTMKSLGFDDEEVRTGALKMGTLHSICFELLRKYGIKIGLEWSKFSLIDDKERHEWFKRNTKTLFIANNPEGPKLSKEHKKKIKEMAVGYRKQIAYQKNRGITADEFAQGTFTDLGQRNLRELYLAYQDYLTRNNKFDFDDILVYAYILLDKYPFLLNYISHVMVDEFQDTNEIELKIMQKIANCTKNNNILVVGDEDQSIYGFRGAEVKNLKSLKDYYGYDMRLIHLDENYRSIQSILDFSENLMIENPNRTNKKNLKSQFTSNFKPLCLTFNDRMAEQNFIVDDLLFLINNDLFNYKDIAILLRTNFQSRAIEKSMVKKRIPYVLLSGSSFWQRKEVASFVYILKVIDNDHDIWAIIESLKYPPKGIGEISLRKIEKKLDEFSRKGLSGFEALEYIADGSINIDNGRLSKIGTINLKKYIRLIKVCKSIIYQEDPPTDNDDDNDDRDLVEENVTNIETFKDFPIGKKNLLKVFDLIKNFVKLFHKNREKRKKKSHDENNDDNEEIGELSESDLDSENEIMTESKEDTSTDTLKNILEIKKDILEFEGIDTIPTESFIETSDLKQRFGTMIENNEESTFLKQYLESVTVYSSVQKQLTSENNDDKVIISTIHAAKGLEWPIVYIPSVIEGLLPISNYKVVEKNDELDHLGEERRIFYVASTRAKYLLTITTINQKSGWKETSPSCFLTKNLLSKTNKDCHEVFKSTKNFQKIESFCKKKFNNKEIQYLIGEYNDFIESLKDGLYFEAKIDNVKKIKQEVPIGAGKILTARELMAQQSTNSTFDYHDKKKDKVSKNRRKEIEKISIKVDDVEIPIKKKPKTIDSFMKKKNIK